MAGRCAYNPTTWNLSIGRLATLIAVIAAIGMGLPLNVAPIMAADLFVDNTNPACNDATGNPFCTIGTALFRAEPGDTITVADSTYFEAIRVDKDNLTVKGSGHPTIDGGGVSTVVSIAASGVIFKGFEVTNGIR